MSSYFLLSRSTFRSGTPPPPPFFRDFYNRFFWYGFDADDISSAIPADKKTMFGGTKGKFRGLDILNEVQKGDEYYDDYDDYDRPKKRRNKRRKPLPLYNDYDEEFDNSQRSYYEDDDDDGEFENDYDNQNNKYYDEIEDDVKEEIEFEYEEVQFWRNDDIRPESRPPTKKTMFDNKNNYNSRRTYDEDSINFSEVDNDEWDEDDDLYASDRGRRRRRPQSEGGLMRRRQNDRKSRSTSSPVVNLLDKVFGVDPEEVESQAKEYDSKLGLNSNKLNSDNKIKRGRERRKGYAYRMENDNVDTSSSTKNDEIYPKMNPRMDDTTTKPKNTDNNDVIDVEATVSQPIMPKKKKEPNTKSAYNTKNWKDRAEDMQRVPPGGIPAWGPNGLMNEDALTVAVNQAKEEIQIAEQKVTEKQEKVSNAEQDIFVLKAYVPSIIIIYCTLFYLFH